jgi:hypothetical protein
MTIGDLKVGERGIALCGMGLCGGRFEVLYRYGDFTVVLYNGSSRPTVASNSSQCTRPPTKMIYILTGQKFLWRGYEYTRVRCGYNDAHAIDEEWNLVTIPLNEEVTPL